MLLTCSSNPLLTSIRKSPRLQSYSKFLIELKQFEELATKSVRLALLGRRRIIKQTDKSLCACVRVCVVMGRKR